MWLLTAIFAMLGGNFMMVALSNDMTGLIPEDEKKGAFIIGVVFLIISYAFFGYAIHLGGL